MYSAATSPFASCPVSSARGGMSEHGDHPQSSDTPMQIMSTLATAACVRFLFSARPFRQYRAASMRFIPVKLLASDLQEHGLMMDLFHLARTETLGQSSFLTP